MPGDDFQQPKGGHHAETFLHQSFLTSPSPVCSWDPEASLAKVIEGGSLIYRGQITSPTSQPQTLGLAEKLPTSYYNTEQQLWAKPP